MKRISILGCIAAALLSFVGCEPTTGNEGYEGTNYIYLESDGGRTTIWEQDEAPLAVKVSLTTALEADLSLTFALEGTAGVLELKGNPVTIKAGEKTATVEIVSLNAGKLEAKTNYTLTLDAANSLPEGVALKSGFQFAVTPELVADALTSDQMAIIEAYKKTSGVDLSKYIGYVNVSTVITGITLDTYEPFEQTVTGKTLITLSEASTADAPVLKMLANPMGIEDHMYGRLDTLTVDNETWLDESEYADPCFGILMNGINWNTDSQETFQMSLDGIKFSADSVAFVGEGVDQYEDAITIVPFEYSFTAYDREVLAIESLSKDMEYWTSDATANPAYHLNNTDITEEYAMEEYGEESNWVEASATISNDALVFTFCMATAMDEDYTRVVATYTPNN